MVTIPTPVGKCKENSYTALITWGGSPGLPGFRFPGRGWWYERRPAGAGGRGGGARLGRMAAAAGHRAGQHRAGTGHRAGRARALAWSTYIYIVDLYI